MSKICDVKKMYGQDFNIVTTNAPSNIIKDPTTELLSNTLLVSSPQDDEGNDNNMPSLFVTDYQAKPLQLTYPFYIGNGLNCADSGYLFIDIDNETIQTKKDSNKLIVNTSYLTSASFNKKGVVKVNTNASIDRKLKEKYNDKSINVDSFKDKTFINIDNDGILYVDDNLLTLINNIIDIRVKQKINYIKVLMNVNLKMWIEIIEIDGIPVSSSKDYIYNVGTSNKVEIDNNKMTKLLFNLHYFSFNNESETIEIKDESGKIFEIQFSGDNKTSVINVPENDELYEHILSNIIFIFNPNYFIVNNSSYDQEYRIVFNVNDDNQSVLTFTQNKFKFIDNQGNRNFDIIISGDEHSPESILVNKVLMNDNDTDQIITNTVVNKDIFNDILFNGNDNLIKYSFESFVYNIYDNRHYPLYQYDINFATDGDQTLSLNKSNSELYSFITGILEKQNGNYTIQNSEYKVNIDGTISGDNVGIGTVTIKSFVEPFRNDQDIIISYQIYIMSKLTIFRGKESIGEYIIKTPLKLDLSQSQNT